MISNVRALRTTDALAIDIFVRLRSTTYPKFDLTGVRAHDLQIMNSLTCLHKPFYKNLHSHTAMYLPINVKLPTEGCIRCFHWENSSTLRYGGPLLFSSQ